METSEFEERLRELRRCSGLTQRELANRAGISFTYLSKIESGAMPPPSKKVIFRLADALNFNREELLIIAGKIPSDIVQMLKNVENIKHLRKIGNRRKISLSNSKWGVSIMKNLMNYRSIARVALAMTLVLTVGALLWFASPTPIVKAVDFTFSPAQLSGTLGSNVNFTVRIDIEDVDLLPIKSVDLVIGDEPFFPVTYVDQFQGLPIPSSPSQTLPTTSLSGTSSTINVSVTSGPGWGYGNSAVREAWGYGYDTSTSSWLGWGYHSFDPTSTFGYGYGDGSIMDFTYVTYTISWKSPSNWPSGTYYATMQVWGDNDVVIGEYASVTLSSAAEPAAEPEEPGVTDVSDAVDEEGVFVEEVVAESEDGNVSVTIDEGITGLTEEGEPISEISIIEMEEEDIPPPPTEGHIIGITYNIGPDGATFSEPITLTFSYNPDDLPEGVSEEDLVIAIWDEDSDPPQWVELTCVVDTENNTITAIVDHFTTFAVIALPVEEEEEEVIIPPVEEEEEEEEVVTPPVEEEEEEEEEEEVVTPPVEEEEEEEEVVTPPVEEEEEEEVTPVAEVGLAWWMWVIIGVGSAAVIALLVYFLWYRPQRPPGYSRTD